MTTRRKITKTGKAFALYMRCSTDDQAQKDYTTIDTQREINRDHVAKLGGKIANEYVDEGKSGTNIKRPGFQQLLADAAKGEFDTVCVTYMSRLGRGNAYVIAEYELSKYNVQVEMVKEKFTDDLAGYMGKTMTTMMDGVYPKMVSQWTKAKMEKMVERGYHCGGMTPFGYKKEIICDANGFHSEGKEPPKRLVPDKELAPFVRQAFLMAANRQMISEIARYLTASTTRKWTCTTVKNLLGLETYKGVQVFGEWRNESAHEPIVTIDEWDAAQQYLASRRVERYHPAQSKDDYVYYLRGLVFCPYCGCAYTQASHCGATTRVHYYVCNTQNRAKSGEKHCQVGAINADRLHSAVFSQIRRAAMHPSFMRKILSEYGQNWTPNTEAAESRGPLAKRLQFVDMQIGNYMRAIGEGRALETLLTALERAQKQRDEIVEEIEKLDRQIAMSKRKRPTIPLMCEAWGRFMDDWEALTPEDRIIAIRAFIIRINIKSKELAEVETESVPLPASSIVQAKSQDGSPLLAKANQLTYFPVGYVVDMPDTREQSGIEDFFPHPAFA